MKNPLEWFLHSCLLIVNFGIGFYISEGISINMAHGFSAEKSFLVLFLVALVFVGFYEYTYKRYKSKMSSIQFYLISSLLYLIAPLSGYLFWKFFG